MLTPRAGTAFDDQSWPPKCEDHFVSVHQARRVRLDLVAIDDALGQVEQSWPRIEAGLRDLGIGHKDPFSASIRDNMRLAFAHLD